jgi:hypothetical protein
VLGCVHDGIKEAGKVEVGGRRALHAEAAHRRSLQRSERVRVHALAEPDLALRRD